MRAGAPRSRPKLVQLPYIGANPAGGGAGRGGAAIIERNADTILEEIGIEFRDDAEALAAVEGGRRRREGHARAFPARPAALDHPEDRAAGICPARAQSRAQRRSSAASHGVRAGLRPALRPRSRRGPPLRHHRGFPQFREARLYGAVDPPFGRHGVRAGRPAGQQAPSRHGLQPHALFRQAVHGLGHPSRARRRTRSRWRRSSSARSSSTRTPSSPA